jgi:hypothetical protein
MADHIFQLETELQNIPEAAPRASRSFSVSEKLARYGSSALSGVEHLRLLVGKDSIADALLRHFGSLKALSRASFKELRQFLPKAKAVAVMAALSISNIADAEHALSTPLNSAEAIYRANLDMKGFHQAGKSCVRDCYRMAETKGSGSASFAPVKPDRASPARDTLGFGCTSNERFSKSKYIEPSKLTRSSGKKVPVVVIDALQMWSEAQCQVGGKRFIRMNHTGARIFTAFSQAPCTNVSPPT